MPRSPSPKKSVKKTMVKPPSFSLKEAKVPLISGTHLPCKTVQYYGFGARTPLYQLSNLYSCKVHFTIPVDAPQVLLDCMPAWILGRTFKCFSVEHAYQMLTVLASYEQYDEEECPKAMAAFQEGGVLDKWTTLTCWPHKTKRTVEDVLGGYSKHFAKCHGIIPKLFTGLVSNCDFVHRMFGFWPFRKRFSLGQLQAIWGILLEAKYLHNAELREVLLRTGEYKLVEQQRWMGNIKEAEKGLFWGACVSRKKGDYEGYMMGRNFMGEQMMLVRERVRKSRKESKVVEVIVIDD